MLSHCTGWVSLSPLHGEWTLPLPALLETCTPPALTPHAPLLWRQAGEAFLHRACTCTLHTHTQGEVCMHGGYSCSLLLWGKHGGWGMHFGGHTPASCHAWKPSCLHVPAPASPLSGGQTGGNPDISLPLSPSLHNHPLQFHSHGFTFPCLPTPTCQFSGTGCLLHHSDQDPSSGVSRLFSFMHGGMCGEPDSERRRRRASMRRPGEEGGGWEAVPVLEGLPCA